MIELDLNVASFRVILKAVSEENQKAQVRAINYAAKKVRTEASKQIRAQINLPAKYVNENLYIARYAKEGKPEAAIIGRSRHTRLMRYGGKIVTAPAPYGRTGDKLRGIPVGRKAAGISFRVKKGAAKTMKKAFAIPLQSTAAVASDGKDLFGAFIRIGHTKTPASWGKYSYKGKLKHLYGPSVHQLFRRIRHELVPMAYQQFEKEYTRLMKLKLRS